MTAWQLYWMLRLDDIRATLTFAANAFLIFSLIALAVSLLAAFLYGAEESPEKKRAGWRAWRLFLYTLLIPFIVMSLFLTCAKMFVPTTRQMAAIYVVPSMINFATENKKLKTLPNKVIDLAGEWIDELSPKKNAELGETNQTTAQQPQVSTDE
jgi:predicted Na+-dependent transporter